MTNSREILRERLEGRQVNDPCGNKSYALSEGDKVGVFVSVDEDDWDVWIYNGLVASNIRFEVREDRIVYNWELSQEVAESVSEADTIATATARLVSVSDPVEQTSWLALHDVEILDFEESEEEKEVEV